MNNEPSISVVVTCYNSSSTICQCLDALEKQSLPRDIYEIVVVDSSNDESPVLIRNNYPGVRLIHSETRLYYGVARNTGLKFARGNIILFIDSDCIAEKNCVEQHLKAHSVHSDAIAIMGRIANGNPGTFWGWVIFLIEFSLFISSKNGYAIKHLVTANASFKVRAFKDYGIFHNSNFTAEDKRFCELLLINKETFFFEPKAVVAHINRNNLKLIMRHLYFLGQSVAYVRLDSPTLAWPKRYLYLFALLLAPVRSVRILWRSIIYSPELFWRLSLLWPFIFAGFVSLGLGEFHYVWNSFYKRKSSG